MAVQILSLANGLLSTTSQSNVYTSPSPLTTIVKSIRLVNTYTQPVTMNLYFQKGSGTIRNITAQAMSIPPGGLAIDDQEITMGPGDSILGDANYSSGTTTGINYVISGIQR